jgi:hypothetical protein
LRSRSKSISSLPITLTLSAQFGTLDLGSVPLGRVWQVRRLVVQSMLAARERLASDGEYYQPFQLYGYDFLVDAELRVWLCEINASPAVADELLPDLVKALVRTAIDPICPPCVELMGAEASAQYDAEASAAAERGDVFETLYTSPPKEETP